MKDMLSKAINDSQDDWDIWIPYVLLAYMDQAIQRLLDRTSVEVTYKVGDEVWLYQLTVSRGLSKKLSRPLQGSYKIVKKVLDVVFRINSEGQ